MLIAEYKQTFRKQYKYIAQRVVAYSFLSHMHDLYEFVYVIAGGCQVEMNGTAVALKEREALLIPPWHMHALNGSKAEDMLILSFSESCLGDRGSLLSYAAPLPFVPAQETVAYLLGHLFSSPCGDLFTLCAAANMLAADCFGKPDSADFCRQTKSENDLVRRALQYMQQHFTEELTLGSVAKEIGCNASYLSRILNADHGLGFTGFLDAFRFSNAETLLRNTDLPVGEIAAGCGIGSVRSFNRKFQTRYHKTPTQFRREESESFHSHPAFSAKDKDQ